MTDARPAKIGSLVWIAIVIAIAIGAATAASLWQADKIPLLRAYLVAWLYWAGISLGGIAILLLHNLTGGAWGDAIRPTARAAASAIVVMWILFMPILLNVDLLYPWASAATEVSAAIEHKRPYLNVGFFQIRAVVYFVIWFVLLAFIRWQEARRDAAESDELLQRRISRLSGQGMLLFGLAVTFSAIDWMMSLEPEWFSTIYGVQVFVSQGLAALALCVLLYCLGFASKRTKPNSQHDLGKFLLAFVMLWAYMSFSQFLIIWYGNLPEEVIWYKRRLDGNWFWVAMAIVVFHFALPFFLLLGRELKRSAVKLGAVAALLLVINAIEKVWLVEPAYTDGVRFIPWLPAGLLVGIGGVWFAAFALNWPRFAFAESAAQEVHHG